MMTAARSGFEFEFARDTFAYRNELVWEYPAGPEGPGRVTRRAEPPPDYAHRCFVMVRMVRQFFRHARFAPELPPVDEDACQRLIAAVRRRSATRPSPKERRIVIPGWSDMRAFSRDREMALKVACGGAWRSYTLRSHWRMVFPISRAHQARQASGLAASLRSGGLPIVHLVRFPQLTINHGLLLFAQEPPPAASDRERELRFRAYDPNQPDAPVTLSFDPAQRTFHLPANHYWAGGRVDVIHVFRSWWF